MVRRAMLARGALPWLLLLAVAGFIAMALAGHGNYLSALCGSLPAGRLQEVLPLLFPIWSAAEMLLSWLLMLVAMMSPLLAPQIGHIWRCSFPGRRPWALAVFAAGYLAIWGAVGLLLVPAALLLTLWNPQVATVLCALLALLWSSSPAAQTTRNRCHRLYRIGAVGFKADRDCLRQGFMTGIACAAACWPWMLLPMTVADLHLPVMAVVTVILLIERIMPPRRPYWSLPPAGLLAWREIRRLPANCSPALR